MTAGARRALRLAGSAAILAAVLWFIPADSLWSAFTQASPGVLLAALGGFLLCHLLAAFKWRTLMGQAVHLPYATAVRAHFTGLVGALTPLGMIGGDVVRAGVAINGTSQPAAIMLTSIVDRLVDTMALVIIAFGGCLWLGADSTTASLVFAGGGIVLALAFAGAIAGRWFLERSSHPRLTGVRDALRMLMGRPGLVARALVLSLLVQGSLIGLNAYIGITVGVDAPLAAWLVAWPAAKFAAYVPVGVAGIGVREAALVALLRPFGGEAGAVLAAGLLWEAVIIVGALIGWGLFCALPSLRQPTVRPIETS